MSLRLYVFREVEQGHPGSRRAFELLGGPPTHLSSLGSGGSLVVVVVVVVLSTRVGAEGGFRLAP